MTYLYQCHIYDEGEVEIVKHITGEVVKSYVGPFEFS